MIGYLRGRLALAGDDRVIVDVGGVGYVLQVPASTLSQLPAAGSDCRLFTYLHVREDALTLYGFSDPEEEKLFETLLSVSGIGPKVAISILSAVTPETFLRGVMFEDFGLLQRIPGVGKKTAQRIVLELKDRLETGAVPEAGTVIQDGASLPETAFSEAVEALSGLGYSRSEAAAALEGVRGEAGPEPETGRLVRLALKKLGRYA